MPQEFFQEDEAEAILRLAANRGVSGGMSREALMRLAGEVGISPEAVEDAERLLAGQHADAALAEEFRRKQRVDFSELIGARVTVSAILVVVWWFAGHTHFFWPAIPILVILVGVVGDIPKHLFVKSSAYQLAFAKWKAKRDLKALKAEARGDE